MPPVYSDSIPEEISVSAFQKQLARCPWIRDQGPASDSMLMHKIISQEKTPSTSPLC